MQNTTGEYQESSRKSRFGIRSITFGKGNLRTSCFGKRILRKLSKIVGMYGIYIKKDWSECFKTKLWGKTAKIEKNLRNRTWCDACWLRFGHWAYLITSITSHHNKKSTNASGKLESSNDTHQAKWQDLNQEHLPTRSTFLESQHISVRYIR